MVDLIKELLFWLALVTGTAAAVIGALWVIDVTIKRIINYYGIYNDLIQFVIERERKKKEQSKYEGA